MEAAMALASPSLLPNGSLVVLSSLEPPASLPELRAAWLPSAVGLVLKLSLPSGGGGCNLRLVPGATRVDFKGWNGSPARWMLVKIAGGDGTFALCNLHSFLAREQARAAQPAGFDTPDAMDLTEDAESRQLPCHTEPPPELCFLAPVGDGWGGSPTPVAITWSIRAQPQGVARALPSGPSPVDEAMLLSQEEKMLFRRDGLLLLPEAVSLEAANAARRATNVLLYQRALGEGAGGGGELAHSEQSREMFAQLLLAPRLAAALTSLVGEGWTANQGQIAANFPDQGDPGQSWHVDGQQNNNVNPFTCLVCVALSDQMRPDVGNFHAAKGSHVAITEATRRWAEAKRDGKTQGVQYPAAIHRQCTPGKLSPVELPCGGACIVHAKLAHRRGFNESDDIRYMAIFRIKSARHAANNWSQVAEPFHPANYPGLQR